MNRTIITKLSPLLLVIVCFTLGQVQADEQQTLKVSQKGQLLYKANFANINGWRVSSGTWTPKGDELVATQTPGKAHSAHIVTNRGRAVNVIVEYEVYIGEATTIEMTIDDRPKKLGRIALNRKAFKGLSTHRLKRPKKAFNRVDASFKPDQWHKVQIEMIGNQIVAQIGEHTSFSIDDNWTGKPKRLGLLVKKGPGKFRNLKVWKALPLEE